ncbi:MAG TPA: ClpXP protease specificity-enhancing factor SspB [Rhodopila sp.]|uniref:SspB family protein n=1 Tax=Rhodopila sp. TaxID=2480087 RepID=UPI002CDFC214|nr:ClpXP protease specificity-enhancing factor SspB [Rhodopila sp.]HVY13683.1 ClpXP protease specificity-enhancing factor SspB [Rhodopila sp.]
MDDDQKRPESLLPYEKWIEQALRHVVAQAIEHVGEHGLPGGHHFYITFRTSHPGVDMPARIRAQYPREMTIVLQHQFWDLGFDRETETIHVGLSFGGVPAKLTIPLGAIVEFADPHIRYGLRFQPEEQTEAEPSKVEQPGESEPEKPAGLLGSPAKEPEEQPEQGQVVSLDAFRRRSPQ